MRFLLQLLLLGFATTSICTAVRYGNNNEENINGNNLSWRELTQDDAYSYRRYGGDDPYFPQYDDAYLDDKVYINKTDVDELNDEEDEATEAKSTLKRSPVLIGLSYILPLAGTASALYCTAVALYFSKWDFLMNRYLDEGVTCKGIILASDPKINEVLETEEKKLRRRRLLKTRSSGLESFDESRGISDYVTMTEDEEDASFQNPDEKLTQDSEDSGDRFIDRNLEYPNSNRNFSTSWTSNKMMNASNSMLVTKKTRDVRFKLDNLPSFGKSSNITERKIPQRKFRVVVEYDNMEYVTSDDQNIPNRIRKQLVVNGSDMQLKTTSSEEIGLDDESEIFVDLYVLSGYPMSGYPRKEVYRALRWYRRLAVLGPLLFGFAVIASAAAIAWLIFPPIFLFAYAAIILIVIPCVRGFLGGSIARLISREYLEQGINLSPAQSTEKLDESQIFIMLEEQNANTR
mmetsp:Transcript_29164/g.61928  ORF Transcript_29164/g.61928 Transcript_29164/m.61928 type:complete len:460 (+) Transcript_29164:145-1524(+)